MGFSLGNTKLGIEISNTSIPPGDTCNGKTKTCWEECFGFDGHYNSQHVKAAHQRNWEVTKQEDFTKIAVQQLRAMRTDLTRIHAVGDFYKCDPPRAPDAYIKDWLTVVSNMRDMHFFAYTRQWRIPELQKALIKLSHQPNFTLWLSCDRDTGRPPRWSKCKWAYMSVDDRDSPRYKVQIVFRAGSRRVPRKKDDNGNLICPYEQGIKRQVKITCASCGICFNQARQYPPKLSLPVLVPFAG